MNGWSSYTGDLFIEVNICVKPVAHLDELITGEWCTNERQILQKNTPLVLKSVLFPSPRLVALTKLDSAIFPIVLPIFYPIQSSMYTLLYLSLCVCVCVCVCVHTWEELAVGLGHIEKVGRPSFHTAHSVFLINLDTVECTLESSIQKIWTRSLKNHMSGSCNSTTPPILCFVCV